MNDTSKDLGKKAAALYAANLIQDDMIIGIGTGSTAGYFIQFLGQRCQEGLKVRAVATSEKSKMMAEKSGIAIIDANEVDYVDFDIDGADEINSQKQMIKGGGGALLREKIVAYMSKEMIVVIDESKRVEKLGKFPLPVEIVPFAYLTTVKHLNSHGFLGKMRINEKNELFLTDNGNYIYDIYFKNVIDQPLEVERKIKKIPGVIETGFFLEIAGRVIVGFNDGLVEVR